MTALKLKAGLEARESAARAEWSEKISLSWRQGVLDIINTGRLLIEAKSRLAHGTFLAMVRGDLPFGARTAEALMKIARDPRIAKNLERMPASWGTLVEISRLDNDCFEKMLSSGDIRPDVERAKLIKKLRCPAPRSRLNLGDPRTWSVGYLSRVIAALGDLRAEIGAAEDSLSVGECLPRHKLDSILRGVR